MNDTIISWCKCPENADVTQEIARKRVMDGSLKFIKETSECEGTPQEKIFGWLVCIECDKYINLKRESVV